MNPSIVTLTSDFGLTDAYVAEMKGAVLRHAPAARLIDVTHAIPAHDLLAASITLQRVLAAFGPGTVHLVVVDPGVGTRRKMLVVSINRQTVVCPDNGLITWAWRHWGDGKAFELTWRPAKFSSTFHGRDIMAPVAGMLAAGRARRAVTGDAISPILLDIFPAERSDNVGRIVYIDHFGNAMTNIPGEALMGKNRSVRVRRKWLVIKKTYGDAAPGEALALIGSGGFVEIAVRNGSAAKKLSLRVGDRISIK
jgi:S-adenosyl-L-methionine hydrolase (adenosine-forming)